MRNRLFGASGFVMYLMLTSSGLATDLQMASKICSSANADTISACTAIIDNAGSDASILAPAYVNRSAAFAQSRNFKNAIEDISKAIELTPTMATAYINRAQIHAETGNDRLAILDYSKAIILLRQLRENPEDLYFSYYRRGAIYYKSGDWDDATADFRACTKIDVPQNSWSHIAPAGAIPKLEDAYFMLGQALSKKEPSDAALAAYNKSIDLNPNEKDAYNSRGLLFLRTNRVESAISDFKNAIRIDPRFSLAYFNICEASIPMGEEGIVACNKALEFNKDFPPAYNDLGLSYYNAGYLDLALAACRKASELAPTYRKPLGCLGVVYLKQRNFDKAIAEFTSVIDLAPTDPTSYVNRSFAYWQKGDTANSIADCQTALKITPEDADIKKSCAYWNSHVPTRE